MIAKELTRFLRDNRKWINISTLEKEAGLPASYLSHVIAGRRKLKHYAVIDILVALKPFLTDYVTTSNKIGDILNKK